MSEDYGGCSGEIRAHGPIEEQYEYVAAEAVRASEEHGAIRVLRCTRCGGTEHNWDTPVGPADLRPVPIYRWRPGEDDGWAGYTTDAASLPVNSVCEVWDPAAQEWQPFSAWTEYFHREG